MSTDEIMEMADAYMDNPSPRGALSAFAYSMLTRQALREAIDKLVAETRAAAFDEVNEVLEFHGFDDAVPYINWAKANQKDKT